MIDDPLLGRQFANFRVDRVIGRGGMAQVYYGWDVKLNRPVAIKVIDARYQKNPAYAQRFVREAQAVAAWRHENIIQIFYADDEDGLYYFVMEHVDGQDLGTLLAQYAADGELIRPEEVILIGRAVADALDYAHAKGVIHRDVKPSNIMLAHDGRVVLGDFGLAMDVQQGSLGEVVGTPHYAAPEQARRSADAVSQSDLYSLGVVLYEMLTGAVPFDDPSPGTLALQHLTLEPPAPRSINPALNVETETVLLKALSKSPKDRYQTGKDLMNALERALLISIPNPAAKLSLPPPPVAAPKAPRRPSRLSITERLASPGPKPPAVKPATAARKQTAWLPLGVIAIIGALAVLGLALGALGIGLADRAESVTTPTATNDQAAITTPTAGSIVSSSTAILVGVGTATAQPEPSHTPPPAPESPTLAVLPTVLYPDGRKFVVFYNDNSFYLLNASDSNSAVTPLAFERLNASGQPLNRFDGWRWAEYYPTINPDRCMSLEIINSQPVLRPKECNELYNSVRTPDRSDNYVFWTTQEGANEFRVLWNDEEIARCQIADGRCEFFLP